MILGWVLYVSQRSFVVNLLGAQLPQSVSAYNQWNSLSFPSSPFYKVQLLMEMLQNNYRSVGEELFLLSVSKMDFE